MSLFKFLKPGETRKFISTCITFFLITISYSVARRIKDTVVVTKMGAEIITFIKMLVILPVSIILIIIYNWLSSRIDKSKLFYSMNGIMLSYFVLYGTVEFFNPNLFKTLSLDADLSSLVPIKIFEMFLFQMSILLKNLPHVVYYVITEMYGSLILSFMFWRHVNENTKLEDTARLYPSYIVAGSLSTAFAGLFGKAIQMTLDSVIGKHHPSYSSYSTFISLVIVSACVSLSLVTHRISVDAMMREKELDPDLADQPKAKKKPKLSFSESIKTLLTNRVVLLMTLCVVSYMSSINIVEVSWKKAVKRFYGSDRAGIDALLSESQLFVGILTVSLSVVCHHVIKRAGWTVSALVNPIVVGLTGVAFLLLSTIGEVTFLNNLLGASTMFVALRIGQSQNVASKACKYSFFDTTKEMALVTLEKDMRDRGKAAVDVLGGRFGKSLGSIIQQLLVVAFVGKERYSDAQEIIAPYLLVVLIVLVCTWIFSTVALGREVSKSSLSSSPKNKG